jgi:hypothetical protein
VEAVVKVPETEDDPFNKLINIEDAIIGSCAALVEKRKDETVQFIHLTGRDLILEAPCLSTNAANSSFASLSDRLTCEAHILIHCLNI